MIDNFRMQLMKWRFCDDDDDEVHDDNDDE